MPTVDDYASLAPFTLEELVGAANAILRDRPALQVQGRTVRYYIANGLLPRPSGGPKFARYGLEHLRRLILIRQWLDEGVSLQEAAARLGEGDGPRTRSTKKELVFGVSEPTREVRLVRRYPLADGCVLEVEADDDVAPRLSRALRALEALVRTRSFDTFKQ